MHDTFKTIFKNEPNCFVAGDYNLDNEEEYVYIEQNNFRDLILQFQEDELIQESEDFSFTMPATKRFPKWRPDKICAPNISDDVKKEQQFFLDPVDA